MRQFLTRLIVCVFLLIAPLLLGFASVPAMVSPAWADTVPKDLQIVLKPSIVTPTGDRFTAIRDNGLVIHVKTSGSVPSFDQRFLAAEDAEEVIFTIPQVREGQTIVYYELLWPGILEASKVTENGPGDAGDTNGEVIKLADCRHTRPGITGTYCKVDIEAKLLPLERIDADFSTRSPLEIEPNSLVLYDNESAQTLEWEVTSQPIQEYRIPGTTTLKAQFTTRNQVISLVSLPSFCPGMSPRSYFPATGDLYSGRISVSDSFNYGGGECQSSFQVERTLHYDVLQQRPGSTFQYAGSFGPVVTTKTVDIVLPSEQRTLEISYYNAVTKALISPAAGQTIKLTPSPLIPGLLAPSMADFANKNPGKVGGIVPSYYRIDFPSLPSGYTNSYQTTNPNYRPGDGGSPIVQESLNLTIESYDLLSKNGAESIYLCPVGAAADSCTPSSSLVESVAAEPDTAAEEPLPEEPELCIPEEMLNFTMGWFYKHIALTLCAIVDISVESAFPLLDVNIPLVTTTVIDGEQVAALERRIMFTDYIASKSSTESAPIGIGGELMKVFANSYTPVAVYNLWSAAYDISRVMVVIALAFYAMMIIYRIDVNKYSLRQFITNALFAILLATFSYQICVLLFDLNRVAAFIVNDTLLKIFVREATAGNVVNFSGWVEGILNWGAGLAIGGGGIWVLATSWTLILPCLGCMLSYALSILSLWIVLFARAIFLYIMVAVSPIVFMLRIIPEFKGMTSAWFKNMIRILTVYPLVVLAYNLLTVVGALFGD